MIRMRLQSGETVSFSETWPQRRIEWMLALASIGTGLAYASPSIVSVDQYELQLRLLPQWAWLMVFVAIGVTRLVFLYINGNYRRSPHIRALGAGMGCVCWGGQALSVFAGGLVTPVLVLWPLFFFFDLHVALTAAAEAARADASGTTPIPDLIQATAITTDPGVVEHDAGST